MAFTRTTDGLVISEDFNAFTLNEQPVGWSKLMTGNAIVQNPQLTGDVFSGRVLCTDLSADGDAYVWPDAVSRTTGVVQCAVRGDNRGGFVGVNDNTRPGVFARRPGVWVARAWLSPYLLDTTQGLHLSYFPPGGGSEQKVTVAHDFNLNVIYIVRLLVSASKIEARVYDKTGTTELCSAQLTPSAAPTDEAIFGAYSVSDNRLFCTFDTFSVYASTVVSCVGLPSGWKLRAGGKTGTAVDGTAQVAVDVPFPLTSIEVLDDNDDVQETIEPEGGVWGGDVFTASNTFIAPVLNETISGTYDVMFTPVLGADAHQLEYSLNGGVDWIVIDDNITIEPVEGVVTYPWDTSSVGDTSGVLLRARGVFITELD